MDDLWLVMRDPAGVNIWHVTGAQAFDERVADYNNQIQALDELARREIPAGIAEAEAFTDVIAGAAVELAWPEEWVSGGAGWTAQMVFGEPHHTLMSTGTVHEGLPALPGVRELYPA